MKRSEFGNDAQTIPRINLKGKELEMYFFIRGQFHCVSVSNTAFFVKFLAGRKGSWVDIRKR